MAWEYIEFTYPVAYQFDKILTWFTSQNISGKSRFYFSLKEKDSDSWAYYAGNVSNALDSESKLTSYGSVEANAQTNYLSADADTTTNRLLAILPLPFLGKYVRIYVDNANDNPTVIHEFRPSTRVLADEIITGRLQITDQFASPPLLTVTSNSVDRIKLGNYTGTTYGIVGYDDTAATVFELSSARRWIAGMDIAPTYIQTAAAEVVIDSDGKSISVNNAAFGSQGIQMQYNGGTPRFYVGDGANNYFKFDGTGVEIQVQTANAIQVKGSGNIRLEDSGDLVLEDSNGVGNDSEVRWEKYGDTTEYWTMYKEGGSSVFYFGPSTQLETEDPLFYLGAKPNAITPSRTHTISYEANTTHTFQISSGALGGGQVFELLSATTNIYNKLFVTGNINTDATLVVGVDASINGALAVGGNETVTGSLNVTKNVVISQNASINQDMYVGEDLNVAGGITTSASILVNSNASINGDLYLGGVIYSATPLLLKEITKPATLSGYGKLYTSSTDHKLHFTNASGCDYVINHLPYNCIEGFDILISPTDTSHDWQIGPGEARDTTNTEDIVLTASITKQLDAVWSAGNNAGGVETLPVVISDTYHMFAIKNVTTDTVDIIFDNSLSPTLPSGYTKYRRVGSFLTNAAANISGYTRVGDLCLWTTPPTDVNVSNLPSATGTLYALSVPTDIQVQAEVSVGQPNTAAIIYFSSIEQDDTTPSIDNPVAQLPYVSESGYRLANQFRIRTDTSGKIRARANAGTSNVVWVSTFGWVDDRRQV